MWVASQKLGLWEDVEEVEVSCARRATERHEARGKCYRLYRHFVYREVGVEEWPRKSKRAAKIAEMLSFLTQSRNRSRAWRR